MSEVVMATVTDDLAVEEAQDAGSKVMVPAKSRRKGQTTPAKIMQKQKQRQALELRKAGLRYWQIAEALGYADESSAQRAVKTAMLDLTVEPAEELKVLEYERYNHLLAAVWNRATQGDLNALDRVLRIQERIEKLFRLEPDTPVIQEVTNNNAVLVIEVQGDEQSYVNALRMARGDAPIDVEVVSEVADIEGSDEGEQEDEEG